MGDGWWRLPPDRHPYRTPERAASTILSADWSRRCCQKIPESGIYWQHLLDQSAEGAAKRFRKAELRDNLLVLVFQRHNLGTLCGIDSHGDVARLNLTTALLGKGIIGLQKTSSTVLGKQTRTHREY